MGRDMIPRDYARLAPTTLHAAPPCYGGYEFWQVHEYKKCPICPVLGQCIANKPLEIKMQEIWDDA